MTVKELRELLDPNIEDAYADDTEVYIDAADYPMLWPIGKAAPIMSKDDVMDKHGKLALMLVPNR